MSTERPDSDRSPAGKLSRRNVLKWLAAAATVCLLALVFGAMEASDGGYAVASAALESNDDGDLDEDVDDDGTQPGFDPAHCRVEGSGTLPNGDEFRGRIRPHRGGRLSGNWAHATAAGDELRGRVTRLNCRLSAGQPSPTDPSSAFFSGPARWNGERGFTFNVEVEDRGAGPDDSYVLSEVRDPAGNVVYITGDFLASGDIRVSPSQ